MLVKHGAFKFVIIKQIVIACDKKTACSAGGQIQQCIVIRITAQSQIKSRLLNEGACSKRNQNAFTMITWPIF